MASTTLDQRRRGRLKALQRQVQSEGSLLQLRVATVSIVTIGLFVAAVFPWNVRLAYTESILALFLAIAFANHRLTRSGRVAPWVNYVAATLQIGLLTWFLVAPHPFVENLPPAMAVRESGFRFLLIFVATAALTLSVQLALWVGLAAALAWGIAVAWVVAQPGTIVATGATPEMALAKRMALYFDPNFVDVTDQAISILVMLIIAGILATIVARSNRLAESYTKAERARFNLARHFSPNMVDELATADFPFGPVRRQEVAVLFADIVGFTAYSEEHQPEVVFDLLRGFHRRMEQTIFDHGGTVDNYMGDSVMATFGVPKPEPDDAARALACARAMVASMEAWNAQRVAAGELPIDFRVGCQFGPVVIGAIGSERSLSVTVVGDTANVASRLQAACRDLAARAAFGDALVRAACATGGEAARAGLVEHGETALRGRDAPVHVWTIPLAGDVGAGLPRA